MPNPQILIANASTERQLIDFENALSIDGYEWENSAHAALQPSRRVSIARTLLLLVALAFSPPIAARPAVVAAQFGPPVNFSCVNSRAPMVVADFNRDGNADIVASAVIGGSLLFGDGKGDFTTATNYSFGSAHGIGCGDFNGDGNSDLFVRGYSDGTMLLGGGAGSFPARTNFPLYTFYDTFGATVADFNGDGKLDVAVENIRSSFAVIAFGRGDGTFLLPTTNYYNLTDEPSGIYAVGRNGSARLDLVISLGVDVVTTNSFCVLINKGDGTFAAPRYFGTAGSADYHESLELGDFNGDGRFDVAVLNYNAKSVTIWTKNANESFTPAHTYALGFSPTTIASADFNGDNTIDFIIRGGTAAKVLLGNGDGSFIVGALMSVPDDVETKYGDHHGAVGDVVVGDFNGDGTPDLGFSNCSGNSVAIMLNQTAPALRLTAYPGYNQLSWSAAFGAGFTLEYATNITAENWLPFPFPPVLIGNEKAVTDWASGDQMFYRLRKQ